MADTIQKLVEFESDGPCGAYKAGEALKVGFVYLSGTAYTLLQCEASGTKRPVGVCMNNYSAADTVTVIDRGIVNLIADTALSAGQPVFPADTAGRIIATGKVDGSGVSYFQGGFGTVVKGGAASAVVQVKLQVL
jgi:hypothetical protein